MAEEMRIHMRKGKWKALDLLPSLRTLARDYRSTVSAVRLALDQLLLEQQIEQNPMRRWVVMRNPTLAASAQGLVLFVLTDPLKETTAGSYWMELHRGAISAVARMHAPLLTIHAHTWQDAQPLEYLNLPLRGIALAGRFTSGNLRAYERLPLPIAYLDTPTEGMRLHSASVDNENVAYDATRRMIALGHRRIAFVRFVLYTLKDIDPDSKERQAGFVRAMKEAGLDPGGLFSHLPGKAPQHSLQALLRKRPRYTATFCVGTASAMIFVREIHAAGLEVPRDLSLCCLQSINDRVPFSGPALNFHDIALRATLLLDRPKDPPIRERVGAIWRDRGSLVACRQG